MGVAVSKKGEVVVTEESEHCVFVMRPNGEKTLSFGSFGSGPGQFEHPRGVTITNKGNILVVDRNNNRIQKFTPDGRFLAVVRSEGKGHL